MRGSLVFQWKRLSQLLTVFMLALNISEATQSLITAAETRETRVMLMQPEANWEEYLTPAPRSIALLGELVFISSGTDFSLIRNTSITFMYLKYPDSFRACLMQVCNSGWKAFNEAHKSMDRIRLHTSAIPDYIKSTVQILFNAPDNVIEKILPSQLENIHSIADDCKILAENVEKKYLDVINLIGELLEAITNAELIYGNELKKAKNDLASLKLREKSAKAVKEQAKQMMDTMAKELEDAQETYKRSMDSLPSGWSIIGMNFVEGLAKTVSGLLDGVVTVVTLGQGGRKRKAEKESTDNDNENVRNDEGGDLMAEVTACSRSPQILNQANNLIQYVNGNDIDWKNLYDPKNKMVKTEWDLNEFVRIRGELESLPKSKVSSEALAICDQGISICKELGKHTPEKEWKKEETLHLVQSIRKLKDGAIRFDTVSKKRLNSPALSPNPPMKHKVEKESSGGKSAGQIETENARLRMEQSSEQLKSARQLHGEYLKNLENKNKELDDILIKMKNINIKEVEFETTIKMLVKGLQAMGEIKEQWNKMVLFFQIISSIISISLHKTLKDFALTSDKAQALTYSERLFTKDLIYTQAFQASNVANMVNMISSTYTQVSNKYLMDRMSSLSRLMTLDPQSPAFNSERQKLQSSCEEAGTEILQLARKNKENFEKMSDTRMAKIQGQLKALLPADKPEADQKIKKMVQSVYHEDESTFY